MENVLLKKLNIKAGFSVCIINAPSNAAIIFGNIPGEVIFNFSVEENQDAYLLFAITKSDLYTRLEKIKAWMSNQTIVWVFYPKANTSLSADLNLMQSWGDLNNIGLAPCSSAAVDQIWTGIRIKPIDTQKKSGTGNAEIAKSAYADYIDVVNKVILLPEDLKLAFAAEPLSETSYNSLSYSNKKEYILWIITAKQEKTRMERIAKTIIKLIEGKKNPTEK